MSIPSNLKKFTRIIDGNGKEMLFETEDDSIAAGQEIQAVAALPHMLSAGTWVRQSNDGDAATLGHGSRGLAVVARMRASDGANWRRLSLDNGTNLNLHVKQRVDGVDQFGFGAQPALVNTDQLVTTEKNTDGDEIFKRLVSANLEIENVSASANYHLVDISDTSTWNHTSTTSILLKSISIIINPSTAFRGDISIGYLKNVDGTNGDYVNIITHHFDQSTILDDVEQAFDGYFLCADSHHVSSDNLTDDVAFQTDVNLAAGISTGPSGDGDLVMLITITAGATDISTLIEYDTI